MSGVEIVGIVLGVFPVCIELVKHCCTGIQTLKDMRDYRRVLGELELELEMESCKFFNSLYNLFGDIITEQECVAMFQHPEGAQVRLQLETRLHRLDSAEIFIRAIKALRSELEELQQGFEGIGGVATGTAPGRDAQGAGDAKASITFIHYKDLKQGSIANYRY